MTVRFLHAADLHLGYQQYGSPARYDDFMRAFRHLVVDALDKHVDFLLLAGDLFHKRTVDPLTLYLTTQELIRLRNVGIRVLAVEGNHERPQTRDSLSWLDFLSNMGLLTLLSVSYSEGRLRLEPWSVERGAGAYVDLPEGVRIIGVRYFGASTSRVVGDLAQALEALPGPRPSYCALMLHAGLQGILDQYAATLTRNDLEVLRPHVDYLALGHIHKPFMQDDWLYNPGSLEANSIQEVEWAERGYLDVQVALGESPPHRVTRLGVPQRPFLLLPFPVDRYRDPQALTEGVSRLLEEAVRAEEPPESPVVELRLTGILPFDRADLDVGAIEALVRAACDPVVCHVRDETVPSDFPVQMNASLSRPELERQVLVELLLRDARRADDAEAWADLTLNLKRLALARSDPELLLDELRHFGESAGLC
ncbi:MAG: exonuclease SbcCD subunit D [Anaerolineae bacterium]|nr:exonuclease SbcCD subunit D [Anaerolineae bacterium]